MTDSFNPPPPEYSAPPAPPQQFHPGPSATYPSPSAAWQPTPLPPPTPRKSRTWLWIALTVVILGMLAGGTIALLHYKNQHDKPAPKKVGFYTAADLEPSVQDELQTKLDDGGGGTIDSVGCVDTGPRTWDCHVDISGGDDSTPSVLDLVVNVASDYQTWVSHTSG